MTFTGFSAEGFACLEALEADNSKRTFDANRAGWEQGLLEPAKELVLELGEELGRRVSPRIHADPRVNGSIFRINRDTRFSKDKTPYKTHLDLFFWEGEGRSRECPGFFFRLTPRAIVLGAGMHHMSPSQLERFRAAVAADTTGRDLDEAIRVVRKAGLDVGAEAYKRVPAGYPADHPRAGLLRHDGLFAWRDEPLPKAVGTGRLVGWCAERLERAAPVHRWLVANVA